MADAQPANFGERLRQERKIRHWNQEELAEKIGGSVPSINRWEHDRAVPRSDMLNLLIKLFGKPPEDWGISRQVRWSVPFLRNPYFTGREQIFLRLHKILTANNTVALSQTRAISGLGGIGKTQTALEYAYRYANEYEAVLWVRAASRESLTSDFAELATVLDLSEKKEADQFRLIAAVKRWLETNVPWLLIFDNADDLTLVHDFLPRRPGGAILLTTRSQITGPFIKKIELEQMSCEEGVTFLLQHVASSKDGEESLPKEVSDSELHAAEEIWKLMAGLPLALDQAAAYIEENQCSLMDYLTLYHVRRDVLLQRRGSLRQRDYPDSVATTWLLSFQQIEQANPAVSDLLQLCSFLHPDAIPEEMIVASVTDLGPNLHIAAHDQVLWDGTIGTLQRYSLVQRNPETKMLRVHRLVQAVLQDMQDKETKRIWAERAMLAVNAVFPEAEHKAWAQCERLLMQALTVTQIIDQYQIVSEEAGYLLSKTASYLRERAQYSEAEQLLVRALSIHEQHVGVDHLDTARSLNNLAELYRQQGKYEQAEPLFQRALSIREQRLGAEHTDTARNLNNLAILYWQQSKYEQAEPLFQRALSIYEQRLGAEHIDTARSLNGLANLYLQQGKYEQAEPLYQRTLAIWEQQLGVEHHYTAGCLNNLAELYRQQGKYEQAEPLFQRALMIFELRLGVEHPDTARSLNNLAELYQQQGKYEQAEPLFQRALTIYEQHLVADHLDTSESLYGLAKIYQYQGKYEQAKALYQRALAIREQQLGPTHPETQNVQRDYAVFLHEMEADAGVVQAAVLDISSEPSAEGEA